MRIRPLSMMFQHIRVVVTSSIHKNLLPTIPRPLFLPLAPTVPIPSEMNQSFSVSMKWLPEGTGRPTFWTSSRYSKTFPSI